MIEAAGAAAGSGGGAQLYHCLCASMNLHHAYLRCLPSPPPTSQQVAAFVVRVAGAHSWYKHLPLERRCTFVFKLDATAGMRHTKEGYIPYTEDDGTRFHYTWLESTAYHLRSIRMATKILN